MSGVDVASSTSEFAIGRNLVAFGFVRDTFVFANASICDAHLVVKKPVDELSVGLLDGFGANGEIRNVGVHVCRRRSVSNRI